MKKILRKIWTRKEIQIYIRNVNKVKKKKTRHLIRKK